MTHRKVPPNNYIGPLTSRYVLPIKKERLVPNEL